MGYVFISAHSNEVHYKCMDLLKDHEYFIITSVDLDETFWKIGLSWPEAEIPGRKAGDAQRLLIEYGYELHEFADNRLFQLKDTLDGRPGMLFATKNKQ